MLNTRLGSRPISPKTQLEQEKRIRREIANSNERRRMQSINAGFQSLRNLLPHHEGEKLSKAAILQHTSEFIYQLEQEKTRLLAQNCQLKRLLNQQMNNQDSDGSSLDSPLPKRKKPENNVHVEEVNLWKTPLDVETRCLPSTTQESSDEGIGHMSPSGHGRGQDTPSVSTNDHLQKELLELRLQLERERSLRALVEEKARSLEAQIYPDEKEKIEMDETNSQHQEHYEHCSAEYSPMDKCSELFSEQRVPSPGVQETKVKEEEDIRVMTLESEEAVEETEPHDLSAKGSLCTLPAMMPSSPNTLLEETPSVVVVIRPTPEHRVSQEEKEIVEEQEQESDDVKEESVEEEIPVGVEFQSHNGHLYHASTSRQNLETIVEAIRHLEGDHLFLDDPQEEVLVQSSEVQEVPSRSTALACGGHEYAIRQQVIHCSVARPGVIVTNHS